MALSEGVNSYVTVTDANAYFTDRLDVAAWTAADATMRAQALITATTVLDDMPWTGTAISESQPLAFPRNGDYFDPRLGIAVTLTEDTPTRIRTATMELAYHFLNNDGVLDDTGLVKDLQAGSISLGTIIPPNTLPALVRRTIKPLLVNSGSNSWWRAN